MCVCVCVWVGVVPRVCEAMEAASARPGSAPAGKPPAKRLGKHRALHPSDSNDFLKRKYIIFEVILLIKTHYVDQNHCKKYNVISGVLTYLGASGMKNSCLQLDS